MTINFHLTGENFLTDHKKETRRAQREAGLIEAQRILEEAHGEVLTDPLIWYTPESFLDELLRADELLMNALDYVEDQLRSIRL